MTVQEEIVMLNRQATAIRQARIDMEAELAQIERLSATRCNCDGDYDYERGRYLATHSEICPEHDVCQDCDDAKATEIVENRKVCADCAKDYETLKGRWTESAGGWCLEVQNDANHFCDPLGWRILAFITPNVRRTGFLAEIGSGQAIGVGFGCRRGSYRTIEEAKAMIVKATAVEIVEAA